MQNYIYILVLGFFLFATYLYILINFDKKINKLNISDKNFTKPQAFHIHPTPRIGGLILFVNLVFISILVSFFENIDIKFFIGITPLFLIGFLDDIKILEHPKLRIILLIMTILFDVKT